MNGYFGAVPAVPLPLGLELAPVLPLLAGGLLAVLLVLGLTVVLLLDAVPAVGAVDWPAVVPLPVAFWLPELLWFVVPLAVLVVLVLEGEEPLAVPVPLPLLPLGALLPPELGDAAPVFTDVSVLPAVPAVGAADWPAVLP